MVTVAIGAAALAAALFCLPGAPGPVRLRAMGTGHDGGTGAGVLQGWRRHGPLVLAGLCACAGTVVLGPVGGLAAAVGVIGTRRARLRSAAVRRAAQATAELADALARIADELRTGAHPASALAGVIHDGPLARELLAPADAAARLGEPVPAALRRSATATTGTARAEMERVATAWDLADRYGAPLADLLGGVLDDLRWRLGHASRVRSLLAGPRSTATVLTALPLVGLGLGQLMGSDPVTVLRDGLIGQSLLLCGCGLAAAGMVWSNHILRAAVPT